MCIEIAIVVHAFERFFFNFYGLFNAEFFEDFRHGNNSSLTSKSPLIPKFKNISFFLLKIAVHLVFIYKNGSQYRFHPSVIIVIL